MGYYFLDTQYILKTISYLCRFLGYSYSLCLLHLVTARKVVETAPHVDQLNRSTVPVEVHQAPKRLSSVHAAKENAFVPAINAEMHITIRRKVIMHQRVGFSISFRQRFGPIPGLARQIWTGIFWKVLYAERVVPSEAQP